MVWLPHWPKIGEMSSMKLGLERMITLMEALGNPEKRMPPVIHVAGTNGKGSTTAFLKSILESAGMKVHVLTSPHLERFNERIVLSGKEISDEYLYNILEEIRIVAQEKEIPVSFFEGITAAAFLAFSRIEADVTLIEVGLGGRLDATNVIEDKLASIITPISYDHMNVLGGTLTEIAREKCGIMRKNIPCVVSMQEDEASKSIQNFAFELGVPLIQYEYDYGLLKEGDEVKYRSHGFELEMKLSLPGDHQYVNASTAISALRSIYGNKMSAEVIKRGIYNASWKGRLQHVTGGRIKKLFPDCDIWLECAHNPAGAKALSAWLSRQEPIDTYLIFSMTRNRDVNAFLSLIDMDFKKIICTNIYSEPMGYKGKDIPPLVQGNLKDKCVDADSVEQAMEIISKEKTGSVKRVIVAGSIFMVSDFLIANQN